MILNLNPYLLGILGVTLLALAISTVVRFVALKLSDSVTTRERWKSLKAWWVLASIWSLAIILGQVGVAAMLCVASVIAFREFIRLLGPRDEIGWPMEISLCLLIVVYYVAIVAGWGADVLWVFPMVMVLVIGSMSALIYQPKKYLRFSAGTFWGMMLTVVGLSHALLLCHVPGSTTPLAGELSWFLYLILLTETNDIGQALVGRRWGKHRISPRISPNKSAEGLVGGLLLTVIVSLCLAPALTTFSTMGFYPSEIVLASVSGVLISLVGYLGDINMSGAKRDAGVKDGSRLFPGMGGMIDRIDSLTFTAPAFYYFLIILKSFAFPSE